MKIGRVLCVATILFCLAALPQTLMSQQEAKQKSTVNLGAFVKEIMKFKIEGNRIELAMWYPFEFYVEANLAEGGQTRTVVERDIGFLKQYLTVIVQCSIDQPDGSSLYSSEKEVRARAVLKLANGTEIHPLDKVPPAVSATVAAMKVVMASEGDPGGANMHVLVFPTKNKQGQSIVDTAQKDKLTLVLKADRKFNETIFTWHTPFDATTSVPPCPDCGESVSAKWSFCPWCGKKLSKVGMPIQGQQDDKTKTIATGNKVIITGQLVRKDGSPVTRASVSVKEFKDGKPRWEIVRIGGRAMWLGPTCAIYSEAKGRFKLELDLDVFQGAEEFVLLAFDPVAFAINRGKPWPLRDRNGATTTLKFPKPIKNLDLGEIVVQW